jgi:hypothetical protein
MEQGAICGDSSFEMLRTRICEMRFRDSPHSINELLRRGAAVLATWRLTAATILAILAEELR